MKKTMLLLLIIFYFSVLNSSFSELPKTLEPDLSLGRSSKVLANKVIVRFKGPVHSMEAAENLLKNSGLTVSKQLLDRSMSLRYGTAKKQNSLLSINKYSEIYKTEEALLRTYYVDFQGDVPPELFCEQLLISNKNIELAEPYTIDRPLLTIPNDPRVTMQGVLNTIKAFNAWDITKGDTNVIIGISDNGVFQEHEDITGNIATNWGEIPNNGRDDDGNGFPDDFRGANLAFGMDGKSPGNTYNPSESHGTSVAGIAAAATDNAKGIAGIGFKCRLFPIKTSPYDVDDIYYGYESILYAAKRGCKVLNCSWGTVKKPSSVDKSIIDYAIANDVAIVAACGNNYHSTDITLPAGYDGVLGVGEVDALDNITNSTSIGPQTMIMAQGYGNHAPNNNNSYEQLTNGTSYASPVIAGVVALVRSRYPNLNARQAIELVRQSTDELSLGNDEQYNFFVPGRVNLLKALQNDNITIPSIRPKSLIIKNSSGEVTNRLQAGDDIKLTFNAFNYLSEAKNLRFALSIYRASTASLKVTDSVAHIAEVKANSVAEIGEFGIHVNSVNPSYVFFRVDIYGENDYHDFFIWRFTPKSDITTLSNEVISFSVGDRATFGYGMKDLGFQGVGFVYKDFLSQLYKSGIMATESNTNTISALHDNNSFDSNSFKNYKTFTGTDKNIGVFSDSSQYSVNPIGLLIKTEYTFPSSKIPVTRILVNIKNISGKTLKALSVGYFADWDIGFITDSNWVRLFPEAYPEFFAPVAMAAEIAGSKYSGFPVFAIMSFSPDASNEAQACGMNYDVASNFTQGYQIASLNGGTDIQMDSIKDVSMVVGMRFPGDFPAGEERNFVVLIGANDTPERLAQDFMNVLLGTDVSDEKIDDSAFNIFPNPAVNMLFVETNDKNSSYMVDIFDLKGKCVYSASFINPASGISINVENFCPGAYFLKVYNAEKHSIKMFINE